MRKLILSIMLLAFTASLNLNCGGSTDAEKAKKDEDTLNLFFLLLLINSASTASSSSSSGGTCFFAGTSGGCSSSAPYTCNNSSFCSSSSTCSNLTGCNRSVGTSEVGSVDGKNILEGDAVTLSDFISSPKDTTKSQSKTGK